MTNLYHAAQVESDYVDNNPSAGVNFTLTRSQLTTYINSNFTGKVTLNFRILSHKNYTWYKIAEAFP